MKFRKSVLVLLLSAVPLCFLLFPAAVPVLTGCATPSRVSAVPAEPLPDYSRDLYSFPKFDLPSSKHPGSAGLSVLSIIPEYKDTRSQETSSADKVAVTGAVGGSMTREMLKVFKSFAGSAAEDIEALLLAKGMLAKGPFVLDELTFPDKKGADLIVMMQFIFDIQHAEEKFVRDGVFEGDKHGKVYAGTLSVGMKVFYYLLEPLSEEKMWVKKLDLGTQEFSYELARGQEQYAAGTRFVSDGCGGGRHYTDYAWRDTNKVLYDSRPKLFSDQLKEAYPQLMKTAWKYFDAEEMTALKEKSKEIRDKWGSGSYRRGAPN
jgi:hypothetical protein